MRILRSGPLDPAMNLALDEALLRSGRETLRFYEWDPPGFSLGFFQAATEHPAPDGFVLVRRPTGGGAIAHTGDLTIAWVGPRAPVDEVYRRLNAVVTRALASLGIKVGHGSAEPEAAPRGLCFNAHTRYDLVVAGGKIFGSAQRRGRERFLVHGTLVLEPNPWARGAVSVREILGREVGREEAEASVLEAARILWGPEFLEGDPDPGERAEAVRLVAERYGNDAWTRRR